MAPDVRRTDWRPADPIPMFGEGSTGCLRTVCADSPHVVEGDRGRSRERDAAALVRGLHDVPLGSVPFLDEGPHHIAHAHAPHAVALDASHAGYEVLLLAGVRAAD